MRTFQVQTLIVIPATQESPPLLPSCHQTSHSPSALTLIKKQRETPPSTNFARIRPQCTHRPPSLQGFFCSTLAWPPSTTGFQVRMRLQVCGAAAASPDALLQCHERSGARSGSGLTARPRDTLLRKRLQLSPVHTQTDTQTHTRLQTSFLTPATAARGRAACRCAGRADTVAERAPTASANRPQPPPPPSPAVVKRANHRHRCRRAAPREPGSPAPSVAMKQHLKALSF